MPEITILFNIKEEPIKENIERELRWFDNIKQELRIFHGGKLSFEYKEDEYLVKMGGIERKRRGINSTYRLLPKIENLLVINYNKINKISNKKEIEKWFNTYLNYNNSEISVISSNNIGIEFNVPRNEIDDFISDCERNNFNYDRN